MRDNAVLFQHSQSITKVYICVDIIKIFVSETSLNHTCITIIFHVILCVCIKKENKSTDLYHYHILNFLNLQCIFYIKLNSKPRSLLYYKTGSILIIIIIVSTVNAIFICLKKRFLVDIKHMKNFLENSKSFLLLYILYSSFSL